MVSQICIPYYVKAKMPLYCFYINCVLRITLFTNKKSYITFTVLTDKPLMLTADNNSEELVVTDSGVWINSTTPSLLACRVVEQKDTCTHVHTHTHSDACTNLSHHILFAKAH